MKKDEPIPLASAFATCMVEANVKDPGKAAGLFKKNQEGLAKIVALYSFVLAIKENELEGCGFKQLARAALELSVCAAEGFQPRDVVDKAMTEANEVSVERMKKAKEEGQEIIVNTLGVSGGDLIVEDITNNQKEIDDKWLKKN